jgi:hypothetical protein
MGLIYSASADRAARFAALALTATPQPDEAGRISALQDDLATQLLAATVAVTDLEPTVFLGRAADIARHPMQQMVNCLAALPRVDATRPQSPPSSRWHHAPTSPQDAASATDLWKGVVVAAAVMTHTIQVHAPQLSEDERWGVIRTVAVVAEVLGATRLDLLSHVSMSDADRKDARRWAASLTVEAKEVSRLAGEEPWPATAIIRVPAARGHRPLPVSHCHQLSPATINLGLLLVQRDPSMNDLLAVTRVLAQTSRAAAAALRAGGQGRGDTRRVPATLTAVVLERHADALTCALVPQRAILASLTPSSPVVLAQATALATGAPSVLRRLAANPVEAADAAPDLAAYARAATVATTALTSSVDACVRNHGTAVRDRSDDAPYLWRPANRSDVMPYLHGLTEAAADLRSGLANVTAVTGPDRAAAPPSIDATSALRAALERRQIALRPRLPGHPALTPSFEQVRRVGAESWIA